MIEKISNHLSPQQRSSHLGSSSNRIKKQNKMDGLLRLLRWNKRAATTWVK